MLYVVCETTRTASRHSREERLFFRGGTFPGLESKSPDMFSALQPSIELNTPEDFCFMKQEVPVLQAVWPWSCASRGRCCSVN